MHISDVHDYTDSEDRQKLVEGFLGEQNKKRIKDAIEIIVDEQFDRLEQYGEEYISQTAASRAEAFLEKVLNGDDEAAMALLGNDSDGDRLRLGGCDHGKPWAQVYHGHLFETKGITLRRKIVEAHAELLKSERIKDLESIVDGLTQQVNQLTYDLEQARQRL